MRIFGILSWLFVAAAVAVPSPAGAAPQNVIAATRTFTYDANGYLASQTDWNGNVTNYVNDSHGQPTSITQAAGTSVARQIITTWHATFHLPTQITEPGRITNFSYDANGNLLEKSISAGGLTRSWTFIYNATGEVLTVDGPRTDVTDVTTYTYDSAGNVATITDALGHVTKISSYDPDGRPLSLQDPNGLVITQAYDVRGRLATRQVGGEVTSYTYDPVEQLTKLTRPDGSSLAYAYDPAHRLTGITDALGNHVAYALDAASNRVGEQAFDPANNLTRTRSYAYDSVSRLTQVIGAVGQTTAYAHDANGNVTGATDPLGHVNQYGFDPLNRLVQLTDPNNGVTLSSYDVLDRLTGVIDPRNLATAYAYDGLDDQTSIASPDTGTAQKTYDAAGNVITSVDARGLKTTYAYDALNRLIQATYGDGRIFTYQYDQGTNGIGHLAMMVDSSGHTSWSYDQHGRVIAKHQFAAKMTLSTAMSYDAAGRLAALTYPSGAIVTLSYDAAGRVSGLNSGGAALLSAITYQPFGPVAGWTGGNGITYNRSFDLDGRIGEIAVGGGTIALTYDAASRITDILETGLPAKSFGYDSLNRLTEYMSGAATQTYGYDSDGNRDSLAIGSVTLTYGYEPTSNQLAAIGGAGTVSLSYDADGSAVGENTPTGTSSYRYDGRERMSAAIAGGLTTNYLVNGLGQRIYKSGAALRNLPGSGESFVYDESGHLLGQYDGAGGVIQETVWLGDLPVAVMATHHTPYFVYPDHLGSPHLIADQTGTVIWSWNHDPFGNGLPIGTITYDLRFPGQVFDQETGLHNNGYRDYDPTTGRYVESDPIGITGGINTYAYVEGNPLVGVDPHGLVDLNLLPGSDPLYPLLNQLNDPRYFTVGTHGLNSGFPFYHDYNDEVDSPYGPPYSVADLGKQILNSSWDRRQPIQLLICHAGEGGDNSLASQLADYILANTGINPMILASPNSVRLNTQGAITADPGPGGWHTYHAVSPIPNWGLFNF